MKLSLAQRMEKRPGLFLTLFTAVYAAGSVWAASRRYFFFDEIVTSWLADLPHISQIWPLIARGIELNPPLIFQLTWVIHHTLGGGAVMSRIPAVAGFWLMCFCLYHFVRRRCGTVFGFVAFLLPIFTFPAWDSAVARGYGMMLGMSGLALLCWQLASDGVRRIASLVGLAVGVAGAVSFHYYAVYVAGAIALGEIVRTRDRRKLDLPVWIALVAGLSPLAYYAELVRTASAGASKHFWVSALPRFLYESYADLLGPASMVFILLLTLLIWSSRGEADSKEIRWLPSALRRHEVAVCLVLAAMPLVVYIAGAFGRIPFYSRYVQPVTIGFVAIAACSAHRIGGGSARFQNQLMVLLVWFCLLPWGLWQAAKTIVVRPPADYLRFRPKLPFHSDLPIAFDSESDFIEYFFYGTPEVRSKIYNLLDTEASIRFRGSDTAQRSIALVQTFRDVHNVDYHRFLDAHREFLVARMREEGWVVQSLLADGARVELVSLDKDLGYYSESTSVYHVTMPERGH
jgi:hypothetical protein